VRHIILEQLGWRLLRVWSTDFFLDPDTAAAKLDEALKEILDADRATEVDAALEADRSVLQGTETWDATDDRPDDDDGRDNDLLPEERVTAPDEPDKDDASDARLTVRVPEGPSETSRVTRALHLPGLEGDPSTPCDPIRFYELDYRPLLKKIAAAIIDAEGPITFKRLSDRIARIHGFQRTGKQISSVVWVVSRRLRQYEATADGHKVFWPDGMPPQKLFRYRGLAIKGEHREWREVPHPEKLWIVREVLQNGTDDPARSVADKIGIARVTTQFRAEISDLVHHLTVLEQDEDA
jgi:hypothetical protein